AYQMIAGSDLGISSYSPPALLNVRDNGYFSGQSVVLGWRRALRAGSDLQVRGDYDRTNRDDLNYREVRQTADVDLIYPTRLERHDVISGAGIRISPSMFTQKTPSVDFLPHSLTYSIYSGFVQDAIAIVPSKLTFTLGTKLEYNTFSGFEFQPSGRFAW